MKYNHLQSIILSGKTQRYALKAPTDSFYICDDKRRYIEPTFNKEDSDAEKPVVILVSAVGATGKSALARKLSLDTQLPLLDLGRNKPVADNALSGIITHAYEIKDVGGVLGGLSNGSYGMIIDGIDEGLSKTNTDSFEAFLDDIYNLGKSASGTSFILLGRSQALEECWVYFKEKKVSTGLFTINPFDIDSARHYVDAFTEGVQSSHQEEYQEARDFIIDKLKVAFSGDKKDGFMSFIGYPPVLDSIVALLESERNYHRLLESLKPGARGDIEVRLLKKVAEYILERERIDKVIPNIIEPILVGKPEPIKNHVMQTAFSGVEQAKRLLSICVNKPITVDVCDEPLINEAYEKQLATFLAEHPFLSGKAFRNPVFEAVVLSKLIEEGAEDCYEIIDQYSSTHKHHYHLVNILGAADGEVVVGPSNINTIVQSAMEFAARGSEVSVDVDGPEPDEDGDEHNEIEIEIDVITNDNSDAAKTFAFLTRVNRDVTISLGPKLQGLNIVVPCNVGICGSQEVEMVAPVFIEAKSIQFNTQSLVLRSYKGEGVQMMAGRINSALEKITPNQVRFEVFLEDRDGLHWPLAEYVKTRVTPPLDDALKFKYLRARKILMSFRSHSKGAFKRYQDKINHRRMLKNALGEAVLRQFLGDGVLVEDGNFYKMEPVKLDEHMGVSWHDLRKGEMSEKLIRYLAGIKER